MIRLSTLLAALLLITGSVLAQVQPGERLIKIDQLVSDGFYDEALHEIESLSADYKNQVWDAEARMHRAYIAGNVRQNSDQARTILESIVADFPETEVSLRAQVSLADDWLLRQEYDSKSIVFEEYIQRLESVIAEAGGHPLTSPAVSELGASFLDEDEQINILDLVYRTAASRLKSAATRGRFSHANPDKNGLAVALGWNIRAWILVPEAFRYRQMYSLYDDAAEILEITLETVTDDLTPPTLTGLLPVPSSVVNSPRPLIQLDVTSGRLTEQALAMSSLKMSVDGVIVAPKILPSVNLEPNEPFLSLNVNYRPSEALAIGRHEVAFEIEELGLNQNRATAAWEFTIVDKPNQTTLNVSQDSIIQSRDNHRNEGANTLLTLEKITGKATRNLVAFDLADVQTNGLTNATLVLNIDPDEHVNGWGGGDTVSVQTVTTPWVEGNGKSFGLKKKDQVDGSGQGVTWFSPVDDNISNDSSNSVTQWDGASLFANPATAPPVTVANHQTGELRFDVTQDVLNGAEHGWLLSKDQENKGSKVSFYSKEGAAAAGDTELAPKLILQYGSPSASNGSNQTVALNGSHYLKAITRSSENSSLKEVLQKNATLAYTGQVVITTALNKNPMGQMVARTAYRSWLNDSLTLASLARYTA